MDRIEVHIGVPANLHGVTGETLEVARARPALRAPLTLAEITRLLGAHV